MPGLTGQSIGRYHIREQLGEGGMATVYKAYDTRLERDVALKVLRIDQFIPAQLQQVLQRFEREAKSLAKLSHSNIVNILDFGEHEGMPFLVMEYLPGGTLKQKLGQPIPWRQAVRLLIPVADGLSYAHQHGIIHRDVKPANILLKETGMPVLTDFGIAKLLETSDGQTLTASGVGIGTPEYMAPEQGMGSKTIDARADIYALGIVFYEMVAGRKPYSADTPMAVVLKQISDPLPPPTDFVPDLPESVENVLFKALAKQPDDRYQDMAAMQVALENLLLEAPTVPAAAAPQVDLKTLESPAPTRAAPTRIARETAPARSRFSPKTLIITGSLIVILLLAVFALPALLRQPPAAPAPTSTATRAAPTVTPTPTLDPAIQAALDTIQNEEPLYQTSFDDWDFGGSTGNVGIRDGKLVVAGRDDDFQSEAHLLAYPSNSFAIEFDFQHRDTDLMNPAEPGRCIFEADSGGDNEARRALKTNFFADSVVMVGMEASDEFPSLDGRYDETKPHTVLIIALENQAAIFIDGQIILTYNHGIDTVYGFYHLIAQHQTTCEYDNFKYWDLREMDPAIKTALHRIQNEELFYQNNFDIWDFGEPIENGSVKNGKLLLDGINQDVDFPTNKLTSNSFAIALEFRILPESDLQGHCIVGAENNFGRAFHAAFYRDFADLSYYAPGQSDKLADTRDADIKFNYDMEVFNNLTLIFLDHQIATLLNGQLLYTVPNPDGEIFYSAQVLAAHTNGVCEYDNFRIWDLNDMDSAVKIAFATTQYEQPIYQNSFDKSFSGISEGDVKVENGKLIVATKNQKRAAAKMYNLASDKYAVQFDLRVLEIRGDDGACLFETNNQVDLRFSSARSMSAGFFSDGHASLFRYIHPNRVEFFEGAIGEYDLEKSNTVTLIILGDWIAAFADGSLIYTVLDPAGSSLFRYQEFSAAFNAKCEYDNFKIWDLSDVDFSAGTTATKPTSSFASILDSIAGKTPDYEDDFSNLESGWPTDRNSTGNEMGYQDGAYLIASQDGCYGPSLPTDQVFSDFILEMEVGFFNQGDGSASILFWDEAASYGANIWPNGWVNFHKNVNGIHFDMLGTTVPESSFQTWDTAKHLVLIARQDRMALYVNGRLVIALADTDTTSSQGGLNIAVCSNDPLKVLIDNLKIWDLSGVDFSTSTETTAPALTTSATQQPAWVTDFAEPVLANISGRPPDIQDQFQSSSDAWEHQNNSYITWQKSVKKGEMLLAGVTAYNHSIKSHDYVVELSIRPTIETSQQWYGIDLLNRDDYGGRPAYRFRTDSSMFYFECREQRFEEEITLRPNFLFRLIVKDGRIAIYIDDKPIIYCKDDRYRLFRGDPPTFSITVGLDTVAFSDFKVWDITSLRLP